MTSNENIIKFQNLNVDDEIVVIGMKSISSNFGKSYILKIIRNGDEKPEKMWSTNRINKFIKENELEEEPQKFEFIVKRIAQGKKYGGMLYADFKQECNDDDDGFIELE